MSNGTYDGRAKDSNTQQLEGWYFVTSRTGSTIFFLPFPQLLVHILLSLQIATNDQCQRPSFWIRNTGTHRTLPHQHGSVEQDHHGNPRSESNEASLPVTVEPAMPIKEEMIPFFLFEVFLFLGFGKMVQGNVEDSDGHSDGERYEETEPQSGQTPPVIPRSLSSDGRKSLLPNFLGVLENFQIEMSM